MLSSIKQILYRPIGVYHTFSKVQKRRNRSKNRIFLLNIPSHGNLGDHLLSVIEQKFLKDHFPEKEIILVSSADLYFSINIALMDVQEDDILCVTGGGFMGSLYAEEQRILTIVKRFPNNKIIFFPQTIYYEHDDRSNILLKKARRVYSAHKNLYVMARDKTTYELLVTKLMPNASHRVYLIPDMALYAHLPQNNTRNGVLWCLRHDAEVNEENALTIDRIKDAVKSLHLCERYTDTYIFKPVPPEKEFEEVQAKLSEISKAQLVITDRLHGMIYSIITDTPVIALDNLSRKVSQVYNLWLKDIAFVKVIRDVTEISAAIDSLLIQKEFHYNSTHIQKLYQPIIDAINE